MKLTLLEKIQYPGHMPVKAEILAIKEHPLHLHTDIEVIYVVKGSINLRLSYHDYELIVGDVHIVNYADIHGITALEDDNRVFLLHLNLDYWRQYHPDIEDNIFICDDYCNRHDSEKMRKIRGCLKDIIVVMTDGESDCEEKIRSLTHACILYLMNDFSYFTIDGKIFKSGNRYQKDAFQMQRINRVIRLIYGNYMNRMSLADVAEQVHISGYYLSHLIKYAVGYSFRNLLSFVRVEQSERLLLETNYSISSVSSRCGFSSTKYYRKHFMKWFVIDPEQYRKIYWQQTIMHKPAIVQNVTREAVNEMLAGQPTIGPFLVAVIESIPKNAEVLDLEYLKTSPIISKGHWPFTLTLDDINEGLSRKYGELLDVVKRDINISHIRIHGFLGRIKNTVATGGWDWLLPLLNLLHSRKISPVFVLGQACLNSETGIAVNSRLLSFLTFCARHFDSESIKKWQLELPACMDMEIIKGIKGTYCGTGITGTGKKEIAAINPLYDTSLMPALLLESVINKKDYGMLSSILLHDPLDRYLLEGKMFHGARGITTINGLKKPLYYGFSFLSGLGDQILARKPNYIATKKPDQLQLLFYNFSEEYYVSPCYQVEPRVFVARIRNRDSLTRVTYYKVPAAQKTAIDYWGDMGSPDTMTAREIELVNILTHPRAEFTMVPPTQCYNIKIELQVNDCALLIVDSKFIA